MHSPHRLPLILLLLTISLLAPALALLSCMNDKGLPVDFWVAVKAPDSFNYILADNTNETLTYSQYQMNMTGWALVLWFCDSSSPRPRRPGQHRLANLVLEITGSNIIHNISHLALFFF
jgi:hypothetical protein